MINILIRSHGRPNDLSRCVHSIKSQTYKDVHLIVSEDSPIQTAPKILESSGLSYELIFLQNNGVPYSWNLYCNELKDRVKSGWFFYLDDDDFFVNRNSLQSISEYLTPYGTLCQFKRGTLAKPNLTHGKWLKPKDIVSGRVGGSCIFLYHTHKHVADWDDKKAADYRFIKAVTEKIPVKFIKIPIIQAGNNGRHGN